jgi:hypothetical protein
MESWAAQERLRAVERALWWRGWVGRPDLAAVFGISAAQASSDLQKYQELNPGAMVYQMSRKRYESTEAMACVLHVPRLEEGLAAFLQQGGLGLVTGGALIEGPRVAVVRPPRREVAAVIERRILLAVVQEKKLRVKYHSLSSGRAGWRWLSPHALGHDGLRWHARAWCHQSGEHRDFVLGRMSDAEWPVDEAEAPPRDEDWETLEERRYRVNDGLGAEQQAALKLDYGTGPAGILKLTCRRAMRQYVEAMLRVRVAGVQPAHFVSE